MTLPKIFSQASKDFNNYSAMSFEAANNIANINSLSHNEQQPAQNQHQSVVNTINVQQPSTMTSTSLPIIQNVADIETNALFGANTNDTVPPLQYNPRNREAQQLLVVECVMPGIYLTKDFISLKEEQLRSHGFTHIIIIDKHIQELYYPNHQPDIFKLFSLHNEKIKSLAHGTRLDSSSSFNAFDYYCPPTTRNHLKFGKEFEVIDLNFGEKTYLTTVLPNCYKAVKFINKALQIGGTILVVDCNGGEQKCLTITVAYLMYKNNINFSNAFARLKEFYKKADLDRFYISQLYEYEPILQVQRAQSRGHSCSRDLHAAILKRKKTHDDDSTLDINNVSCSTSSSCYATNLTTTTTFNNTTTTSELLNNCNPLNKFDSRQMESDRHEIKSSNNYSLTQQQQNYNLNTITRVMSESTIITTGGCCYNWDDCAME